MRLHCPFCEKKATVLTSRRISRKITEATCICTNDECGARFVTRVIADRTLTPPASTLTDSLHEQIALLDPEERRKILMTYREELPLFAH